MIYLDSAATSYHKPECVAEAVGKALKTVGNSGRGVHGPSLAASGILYRTRQLLAELFEADDPARVAFAQNATEALNTAIFGYLVPLLEEGKRVHAVTTEMEHNSVLRPLYALRQKGLSLTILPMDEKGRVPAEAWEKAVRKDTAVFVCTHASNVTGNLNPVEKIGAIARNHGICFIVDAAQTAGVQEISMKKQNIDIVCFSGHKGLLGPQGTGGLCVREEISLQPLKVGGSGIQTFMEEHPKEMPEALEAGTMNIHGLAGLEASLKWLKEKKLKTIREREDKLARLFYEQVADIPGIRIFGDLSAAERSAVISLNLGGRGADQVSSLLWEQYGISTRCGGHCAPLVHRHFETEKQGMVRFSFSFFNTEQEIEEAAKALGEIQRQLEGGM